MRPNSHSGALRTCVIVWLLHCAIASVSAEEALDIGWKELIPVDQLGVWKSDYNYDPNKIGEFLQSIMHLGGEIGPQAAQIGQKSARMVGKLDGKRIRLPGFIVPLESNIEGAITHFLLVPYAGACIHVPPPPPNQIVYVTAKDGYFSGGLDEAVVVEGTLSVGSSDTSLADSGYSMVASEIATY